MAEEGRNGVRQVRRDANERLKKLLKDHKISEDDEKKGLDEVQKITDQHIKLIDDLQKKKDAELLGKVNASIGSMSYFTHLECSRALRRAAARSAPAHHLCRCGAPAARPLRSRPRRAPGRARRSPAATPTMWRYRELMPLFDGEEPVTLGEGLTPLIHARGSAQRSASSGSSSRTSR